MRARSPQRSKRSSGAWRAAAIAAAATLLVLAGPMASWASQGAGGASGLAPRWPIMLVAAALGATGLLAMRLKRSWSELSPTGAVSRCAGIALTSLAVYLTAFGVTQAPPLYSSEGGLNWMKDIELARRVSEARGQAMMIDFTATWCNACHELEAEVFERPQVRERLQREVVLVKIDFDQAAEHQNELLARYEVTGLPRVAFVSPSGELMRAQSFDGKIDVEAFLTRLDGVASGGAGEGEGAAPSSRFERELTEGGLLSTLLLVFVAGFLSSLTPCVYPLIPITIGVFGAAGAKSRWHGLSLSAVYVLGIALTYSALGVAASLFGTVFGGAMQHPAVIAALVGVFVTLGLSSAGLFDLRLPGDLQTRLSAVGGAGYLGALLMGSVAGIIAAPCVGPIVAGVLVYVARQQDALLGGAMLFTFALGLGVIFLLLGTFSSLLSRLPRAGGWMESVKGVFGAIFFGMALYYARYVIPAIGEASEALWRESARFLSVT